MAGRTTIIAHRPIRAADVIFVVNAGRVVEQGDHDGLLALLSARPGAALRTSELARQSGTSMSRLSNAVSSLETKGWIERLPAPGDGRGQLARLTAAGQEQLGLRRPRPRRRGPAAGLRPPCAAGRGAAAPAGRRARRGAAGAAPAAAGGRARDTPRRTRRPGRDACLSPARPGRRRRRQAATPAPPRRPCPPARPARTSGRRRPSPRTGPSARPRPPGRRGRTRPPAAA